MHSVCFISLTAYGYFNNDVPPGGGAQRQLSLLSRVLRDEFNISFIVGDYGQPAVETQDKITFYRAYRPDADSTILSKPRMLWTLRKAMARAGADVYVYRGYPLKAAFVYLLAKSFGKPFVYNLANDSNIDEQPTTLSNPVKWLFERALADAAAVIAQTTYQAQQLEQKYGVHATTVPNGYPANDEFMSQDQREYFLWVGRLDENQKQPHYYLDLAEQIPSETFLLIGPEGQDESYNEQIHDRAGELNNVIDKGAVTPADIHDYYRDAIALVNTSAHEGFPNTFLEAWRYNTAVLSLSVDPNRFVNPEIGGHARDDFEALVDISRTVACDVDMRRSLGEPAGRFVRTELTIETVAERYAAVLWNALDTL